VQLLAAQAGVQPEPNGFYVPPGDPDALRAALTYLLDPPAERARLGLAGRRSVERFFSLELFVQRRDALVEEACSPGTELSRDSRAPALFGHG
jgi:glycosyltransferase involved in cell wall biosynthesis